jgi:hypothetical protein
MEWLTAETATENAGRWAAALDQKIGTLATLHDRCSVARASDAFEEEVRQLLFGEGRGLSFAPMAAVPVGPVTEMG